MSLIDLIPGGRSTLIAGSAILTFGAGFAASQALDHWLPWGSAAQLTRLRNSLPGRDAERYSAGARDQKRTDQEIVDRQWRPALAVCNLERLRGSVSAASSIADERAAAERSSDAAYRLGRATCGGSSAKTPSGSSAAPVSGSLRSTGEDVRSIVARNLGTAP